MIKHAFAGDWPKQCDKCGLPQDAHPTVVEMETVVVDTSEDRVWSTDSEKVFIDGLGGHAAGTHVSRRVLLERYIGAIQRRDDVGRLDRRSLMVYAADAIKKEEVQQ
jgi:hypothetical protein